MYLLKLFSSSVGGLIQSMVWDSNGERLAVLCQGKPTTSSLLQCNLDQCTVNY